MLCDWVSNYLKPSKDQTKCALSLNFLVVFESWPMRSPVVTMKKVDIPSCIAVSTFGSLLKSKTKTNHDQYARVFPCLASAKCICFVF